MRRWAQKTQRLHPKTYFVKGAKRTFRCDSNVWKSDGVMADALMDDADDDAEAEEV